ncbi:MAG: DUF2199 domain-containing protein [Albidovulum sp.]
MSGRNDRRWQRFMATDYRCKCCGQSFGGVLDIGYDHPDQWSHGNRQQSGQSMLTVGEDRLTSDLCTIGEDRFIRCILPIPIVGTDETFRFGAWASLKRENFDLYVRAWQEDNYSGLDGFFGWLCNRLPGVGMTDEMVSCDVVNLDGDTRPEIYVHDAAHRLAGYQKGGMTFDQLLDIFDEAGMDFRSHLGDA